MCVSNTKVYCGSSLKKCVGLFPLTSRVRAVHQWQQTRLCINHLSLWSKHQSFSVKHSIFFFCFLKNVLSQYTLSAPAGYILPALNQLSSCTAFIVPVTSFAVLPSLEVFNLTIFICCLNSSQVWLYDPHFIFLGRHLWLTFQTHLIWQMESCPFPTVPSFVFSPLKSVTHLLSVAITDQSQVKSYICNFHIFGAKISWCYQHTVLMGKYNRMIDF